MPSAVVSLCEASREKLLPAWVEGFFASYPLDSVGFMRTGADPFTNPVGAGTRAALAVLFDAVAGKDVDPDQVRLALDKLIHIRAVQDMTPSRAVGPLYLIKTHLRRHILPALLKESDGLKENQGLEEYLALESRVDTLALMALDLYAACREKLAQMRVDEIKRGQAQVMRWATEQTCKSEG